MKVIAIVMFALWPLNRGLALAAYVCVSAYRRWISPRKGFRCAHGALTGEPSCSDVAARAFRKTTFTQAVPIVRAQFHRCRRTYAAYRNDLIDAANNHLAQFASLAAAGAIGCCPGCDGGGGGGGGDGPLGGRTTDPAHVIVEQHRQPMPPPTTSPVSHRGTT